MIYGHITSTLKPSKFHWKHVERIHINGERCLKANVVANIPQFLNIVRQKHIASIFQPLYQSWLKSSICIFCRFLLFVKKRVVILTDCVFLGVLCSFFQVCCHGILHNHTPGFQCCEDKYILVSPNATGICCGGQIHAVHSGYQCCGGYYRRVLAGKHLGERKWHNTIFNQEEGKGVVK